MGFLAKLARRYFRWKHGIKTEAEVDDFFKELRFPAMLTQKLAKEGFAWKGEWAWLDWNRTPAESLAVTDKKLNCGDFLELYCKLYNKLNVKCEVFLLEKNSRWSWNYKWHYVSLITWQEKPLLQSNNLLQFIVGRDDILSVFKGEFDRMTQIQ